MDEVIIRTKIIPERETSKLLPRPHLINALKENAGKQLIVISSGAGYGKTTLVKQFIESDDFKYSWYKIDESDNNLITFLSYLIGSISYPVEGFGESSSGILDSIKDREGAVPAPASIINTVGGTLVNDLSKTIQHDFYIILDDFHFLPKADWVEMVMEYLLRYLPQNIHVIITTRENEPFDTSKLKAKRKYFEINEELKFSPVEVNRLAQNEYNMEIDEEDIPYLDKFGGWVTGLHMFMQSNREKAFEFLKQDLLPENLYNYFAEDVFNSESDDAQKLLLKSSVLENFTAGECNALFKIKNSAEILEGLSHRNIFIQKAEPVKDGKVEHVYNYQSLFGNYLRHKFVSEVSEQERKDVYKKIAEYYSKEKDRAKTIKYLLQAEEFDSALKSIMNFIDESGSKTNFHMASNWFKLFPASFGDDNPDMLFYKGWLKKNMDGDYENALTLFKEASNHLSKEKTNNSYKIRKYLVEVLIATGKTDEAADIIESVLKEDLPLSQKAEFLYWHGVVLNNFSQYDDAIKKFKEALEIVNIEDASKIKYSISNELGNIHLIKGDYTKAAFYYESVITNTSNLYNKFQTINNIVQVYAYEGSFKKAMEYLEEAEEFVNVYPSQFFKVNYLLSSAYFQYMLCNYKKSISIWQELVTISVKSKISYYVYVGNLNLAICFYYLKDFIKSEEYLHLTEKLSRDLDEGEKIYLNYWKNILNKETEQNESIGAGIEKAVEHYTENGMMYERVHSLYHLADFYLKSGNNKKALEYLGVTFNEGIERKFITIFQKEFLFKRNLFDFASENRLQSGFIENLVASLFELAELSGEELLAGIYDIKLRTFGEVKLTIRGKEIPDEKWVRKIRKLIFIYILLNKKTITKDSLIDLFYPDSEPENATSIFHQTLSNIRSIIKWAVKDDKKDKSPVPEYIVYENQRITLNNDFMYFIDAFEFEKFYAAASSPGLKDNQRITHFERALSLYKGEFLEGYYQPWCEELRERYTNYYISILEEILEIYKKSEETEKIIEYSELLLKTDDLNEEVYLQLIKAQLESKQTDKAKMTYKTMVKTFKKELGEEPSGDVRKKIDKLFE